MCVFVCVQEQKGTEEGLRGEVIYNKMVMGNKTENHWLPLKAAHPVGCVPRWRCFNSLSTTFWRFFEKETAGPEAVD